VALPRQDRWHRQPTPLLGGVAIYVASIVGPPPPKADAIGYAGLAAWLFPVWGYWIDRHREPVP